MVARLRPGDDIQVAINAAPDGGGVVLLANGNYPVSAVVRLRDGVVLQGESRDRVVLDGQVSPEVEAQHWFTAVAGIGVRRAGVANLSIRAPILTAGQSKTIKECIAVKLSRSEDCWVENCRLPYSPSAITLSDCKRVTARGNVTTGRPTTGPPGTAYYTVYDSQDVLLCNEVLLQRSCLLLAKNKNTVVYCCYLAPEVRLEMQAQPRDQILIEGLDSYHIAAYKLSLPATKHKTLYPVTGTCRTAEELEMLYAPDRAERGPGDF